MSLVKSSRGHQERALLLDVVSVSNEGSEVDKEFFKSVKKDSRSQC